METTKNQICMIKGDPIYLIKFSKIIAPTFQFSDTSAYIGYKTITGFTIDCNNKIIDLMRPDLWNIIKVKYV